MLLYMFYIAAFFRLTLLFYCLKFGSNIILNKWIILLSKAWSRRHYFVLFCIHISSTQPANQTKMYFIFFFTNKKHYSKSSISVQLINRASWCWENHIFIKIDIQAIDSSLQHVSKQQLKQSYRYSLTITTIITI